jgi:hypothetical protein
MMTIIVYYIEAIAKDFYINNCCSLNYKHTRSRGRRRNDMDAAAIQNIQCCTTSTAQRRYNKRRMVKRLKSCRGNG